MGDTSGPISVRPASTEDAPAVASLLGQLGYPAQVDRVRSRMARVLAPDEAGASDSVFVASTGGAEGAVVGLLSLHRFSALHADDAVGLITALVVAEDMRGHGVGRLLVDHAVEAARHWGCTRLLVTTHVRRTDAHAFYERIGFELTGRRYARAL